MKNETELCYIPRGWAYARKRLVESFLLKYAAKSPLLDIGCGTGQRWLDLNIVGVDINSDAVKIANNHIRAVKATATDLPFLDEAFSTVLCLDVLEHIPDDQGVVKEAYRVLQPGGLFITSVPLYPYLWSQHDVNLGHVRRYHQGKIRKLLQQEGFYKNYDTRWNVLGIPGAFIRKKHSDINEHVGKFDFLFKIDTLIAAHIPIPIGLSEFVVASKR